MTFEHDEFADTMWVSLSEPVSQCVAVDSDTAGVILRIEQASGIIRSFEVTAWSRRLAKGSILIPEVSDTEFSQRWVAELERLRSLHAQVHFIR